MDRLKEMKLDEAGLRPDIGSRIGNIAKSVRSRGIGSYSRWEWKLEKSSSSQRHNKPADQIKPQEPRGAQLNLKSALMGVHIMADDRDLFFSRQSSMSSMLSSSAVPFKWESEPGKPISQLKAQNDSPWSPLTLPPGSRGNSGLLYSQPLSRDNVQANARSARIPSGLLYPCPNPGSSCQLNAAHFTFDNQQLAKDLAGDSGSENIERIFKRLVGQSRLQQCSSTRGAHSNANFDTRRDFITGGDELSDSPVSTLDCPQSPTSSERSFRGKSKRQSLRSRSEDANLMTAAKLGPTDPSTPRPKSELAQYLMSFSALTENAMDDDDLEGPSEVAWLEPDDDPQDPDLGDGYTSGHGKKKPSHERWSSNSSSWNLSLVPKPLRSVSTIVNRRHATVPGRSVRKSSRQDKVDSVMPTSLTASYDGGTMRSRAVRKSTRSEMNSGRSWWPDLGSGRKSSVWACSGRLQMGVAAEPDLHEPDMEQANDVISRHQQDARAKVDEEDFPFENPIASSFLFQEATKSPSIAAARERPESRASRHKAVISVVDSENDDLQFSDVYHDPEDGSTSDCDGSHISLGLREGSEFVSSRSFKEYRDLTDCIGFSGSLLSDMSGRVLSGYLDLGISGRFSVDLQRGQKLDKAQHTHTPDVRLRVLKSEKSLKRSILSPCLPFLHRSHHKNVPRIQQAPAADAPSRRLQPVNSFTARLGPVAENSTLAAHFQLS